MGLAVFITGSIPLGSTTTKPLRMLFLSGFLLYFNNYQGKSPKSTDKMLFENKFY